ncbi:MAG: glycosyl hydrolase [Bacteroidota bacterium]
MESGLNKRGKRFILAHPLFCVLFLVLSSFALGQKRTAEYSFDSYAAVLNAFRNPPAEFRSAPLWVWNDRMSPEQISEQLADFKAHGIGGVFIHPRPGLITPYLSDEWLSLCRYAVDVGKKLGMKIWIYDENSYPSGFAGGHVPAQMPDAVRTGLRMERATELSKAPDPDLLVVLERTPSGFVDITSQWQTKSFGPGDYYLFTIIKQKPSPWHGGFPYVDLMRRDVTEKFLDVTLNAYKRIIGDEFGKVVPGAFQDEAEISPAGGRDMVVINYTPALFDRFKSKWGYDLRLHLPSLYDDAGEWQRIRHNYYATLLDLFIDGWAKPYYEYCTNNNLIFTGHYWEHEWPRPVINPDNMAFAAYAHMPGIDILMNDFQTDTHAQFGNARAVKEIRSVANQLGKARTMSETFGAGGWEMTFFDQKRIADWEYALGVNFMNQHLSYATIKGARKRDHPLSFSYHEPWWNAYSLLADYYSRLSVVLSSGTQENRIVVIEPTTTAWMYYSARGETDETRSIGKRFQDFVNQLEAAQIEYDLASEAIIEDHGRVKDGRFQIGQRAYELVILPPGMENVDEPTLSLLREYLARGGRVLCYGSEPTYIDGRASDRAKELATRHPVNWLFQRDDGNLEQINRLCPPRLVFDIKSIRTVSPNLLFHHRRSFKDCELLFLANTSSKDSSFGRISAPLRSCERWDLFAGRVEPYPYAVENSRLVVNYSLPPGASLLLCLRPVEGEPGRVEHLKETELKALKETVVERTGQNVLTLDYCDLTLDGKTENDFYFYDAQLKTYQFHGLDRNPWDNAVQYKTNILDKDRFKQDSGFETAFTFTVAQGVNTNSLRAVVERPELYQIFIDGQKLEPLKDQWWLDKAFGVFDIGRVVRIGTNTIILKASPFTIHTELEPVYLLGDFALESQPKGFTMVASERLNLGSWASQGMPFYAERVSYTKDYDVNLGEKKIERIVVKLGRWRGVVTEVRVNGKKAGFIGFEPYELDITENISRGRNRVTVLVYGSLKNTLGPHHNNPPLGRAWPGQFQQAAKGGRPSGSEYSILDYGLFEDFTLKIRTSTTTNR